MGDRDSRNICQASIEKFSWLNMTQKYDWHYQFSSIMNQLRNFRSITLYSVRNRKISFRYRHSRYGAYFEANLNLNTRKGHSRSFKVISGQLRSNNLEKLWSMNIFFVSDLTLEGPEWPGLTLSDLLSCLTFNFLQNKPNIGLPDSGIFLEKTKSFDFWPDIT